VTGRGLEGRRAARPRPRPPPLSRTRRTRVRRRRRWRPSPGGGGGRRRRRRAETQQRQRHHVGRRSVSPAAPEPCRVFPGAPGHPARRPGHLADLLWRLRLPGDCKWGGLGEGRPRGASTGCGILDPRAGRVPVSVCAHPQPLSLRGGL
jgi:hypothetical protein